MSVRRDEIMARVAERVEQRQPLGTRDIERAERLLGIALPADLRDLYLTCGNGGFGPGVRALVHEDDETVPGDLSVKAWSGWGPWEDWSVVRVALSCADDSGWPRGLVDFFSWGCGIESGVDLLDASLRVVRSDPHFEMSGGEQISKTLPARFAGIVPAYVPPSVLPSHRHRYQLESSSLLEWFDVWLEGHSMADLQGMAPQRRRWRGAGE